MITTKSERSPVTLPVLIAAIVALLAFVAAVGYFNFRSRPADTRRRVVSTEEEQQVAQQTAWLKQKSQETGGDWRKLSLEDQQQLKMIAKDQFETILKYYSGSKQP